MKINAIDYGEIIRSEHFDDKYYLNSDLGMTSLVETFSDEELKQVTRDEEEEQVFECNKETFHEFISRVRALEEKEKMMREITSLFKSAEEFLYPFVWDKISGETFWERLARANLAIVEFLIDPDLLNVGGK